jgi:hypothetical protein
LFLPPFVIGPPCLCTSDVLLLALLGAASQQNNNLVPILAELDAVARAIVDSIFENAGAQAIEPGGVSVAPGRIEIFNELHH